MIAYPTIPPTTTAVDPASADLLLSEQPTIEQSTVPDVGWYVDPDRADRVRWWNGRMWTGRIGGDGDPIAWHDHLGELPPPQPGTRIFSVVRSEPESESESVIDLTSNAPSAEFLAAMPAALPMATPAASMVATPGVHAPSRHVAPLARPADLSPAEAAAQFWDGDPIFVSPTKSMVQRVAQRALAAAAAVVVALGGATTAAIIFR